MATHSSVLARRISGMGEPDGLPSMGSHRVGHDRSDLAAAAEAILLGLLLCAWTCSISSQLLQCLPSYSDLAPNLGHTHQRKIGLRFTAHGPAHQNKTQFSPQSLPSGSLHKPLILLHQRVDRLKPQSQKTNQYDHMDHSLSKSMKL